MKPKPTLNQVLDWREYAYAKGIGTFDKAESFMEDMFASGEVSPAEKPRIVCYYVGLQKKYAIACTDTGINA